MFAALSAAEPGFICKTLLTGPPIAVSNGTVASKSTLPFVCSLIVFKVAL